MLDKNIIEQLTGLFSRLNADIAFEMRYKSGSAASDEMRTFLEDVASTSDRLSVISTLGDVEAPTFEIIKEGEPTGVKFCGIPNGHEFSTLLLAILNADGQGKNIPDETTRARIRSLHGPIKLETFVSLTCTNCPDVAQVLNLIALLNADVEHTVTDGAVVPERAKSLNIQSVPTVLADGKQLSVGRSSLGDLLDKLEASYSVNDSTPAEKVTREYDVIILGGGPAGSAAAIYCARKGFSTAIVTKTVGGQVRETMEIENLISVSQTTGPGLATALKEHISRYPIDVFENRTVESASIIGSEKSLVCRHETFICRALIITTGASWRRLAVAGEAEHIGHGVAFCTHCDGPFYAGKRVAVIGGGNSGIEAAIDLAGICPHVDVFEFMDTLKADKVLQTKASSIKNIDIHTSAQVTEILGDGKSVSGIKVKDRASGAEIIYPVSGVFIQIGLTPNSQLFTDTLQLTTSGEIIVDGRCRTSVKGIYAAGDVTNVPYKQIIIAMGEGAKAALSLFEDSMRD